MTPRRRARFLATVFLAVGLASAAMSTRAAATSGYTLGALIEANAGDAEATTRDIEARFAEAQARGDKARELRALRDMLYGRGAQAGDEPLIERGIAMAREQGDLATEAVFWSIKRGWTDELRQAGDDVLVPMLQRAADLAERSGDKDVQLSIYLDYGIFWTYRHRGERALPWLGKALALSEQLNDRVRQVYALMSTANILRLSETSSDAELAKAEAHLLRARSLLDAGRHGRLVSNVDEDLGITYMRQRRYDEARQIWAGLMAGPYHRDALAQGNLNLQIALADLQQKLPAAARERAMDVLAATPPGDGLIFARSGIALARAEASLGHREAAQRALDRARPLVELLKLSKLEAEFHAGVAEAAIQDGNYKVAYDALQRQSEIERMRMTDNAVRRVEELSVLFDLKLRDSDNRALKAEQASSESRRVALMLALALSVVLLSAVAAFLVLQFRQRRRFEVLALRDELTGAPNRRSVTEHIRRECARADEGGQGLFVSILDIDFFKKVNDTYGHEAGDAVLKAFYAACKSKLRPQDVLGRWGGEEFVLVTRSASTAGVDALFERLLAASKAMPLPELRGEGEITFSMGACRVEPGDVAAGIDAVLARADAALYAAKEAGRACWRLAGPAEVAAGNAAETAAEKSVPAPARVAVEAMAALR